MQAPNAVDIVINYSSAESKDCTKTYTAEFNPDTGVQQYLDYYEQGFKHDHPESTRMEIVRIEVYHLDSPQAKTCIYPQAQ